MSEKTRIVRSRRNKLEDKDERILMEDIGESSKAFGTGLADELPDMVPVDIAMRAAEMAYRRGVYQGANYMWWHLRGEQCVSGPGAKFIDKLWRWRMRGESEGYAFAETPVDMVDAHRGLAPKA